MVNEVQGFFFFIVYKAASQKVVLMSNSPLGPLSGEGTSPQPDWPVVFGTVVPKLVDPAGYRGTAAPSGDWAGVARMRKRNTLWSFSIKTCLVVCLLNLVQWHKKKNLSSSTDATNRCWDQRSCTVNKR